jgi:hypothetical protein
VFDPEAVAASNHTASSWTQVVPAHGKGTAPLQPDGTIARYGMCLPLLPPCLLRENCCAVFAIARATSSSQQPPFDCLPCAMLSQVAVPSPQVVRKASRMVWRGRMCCPGGSTAGITAGRRTHRRARTSGKTGRSKQRVCSSIVKTLARRRVHHAALPQRPPTSIGPRTQPLQRPPAGRARRRAARLLVSPPPRAWGLASACSRTYRILE